MKILQINATYGSGSTGTIVRDIQQCCEEQGIECHVAYASSHLPLKEIHRGCKVGNVASNKLHALLSRVNGQQGYFSFLPTLALLRYMRCLKPDVVHLHNMHSNYINLNMLLRYLAKHDIPTVVTLHDCWFYTGGCFHYAHAQCFKWQGRCGHCPKKRQDTPAYLFDRSAQILEDRYRYFGQIKNLTAVGVSEWITHEATKTVFSHAHATTIYNGVDMEVFKPTPSDMRERYGLEGKYVVLGPASKWLAEVNKDVFNTVVKGLGADAVLFLFGCSKKLPPLPPNVVTYGFTRSKEELAKVYSMADVFVNCTREESMSCINVEAQACGTPIITFANTGAAETVDGESGWRVETGNGEALLDAIKRMRKATCSENADKVRKWAKERFEKVTNYQMYIQLYKNCVRENIQ